MLLDRKIRNRVEQINENTRYKSQKYAIYEGAASGMTAAIANDYISTFAIALKASNTQLAVILSFPKVVSSLFQIYVPNVVEFFRTRKLIVLFSILLQALCWLPLVLVPFFFKEVGILFLIFFFTLYIVILDFTAPVWNSFLGDLIDMDTRGNYFAQKNRAANICTALMIIIAGLVLNFFDGINIWIGFSIIFLFALLGKLFSFMIIMRIYDPIKILPKRTEFTFSDFINNLRNTNYGRYVLYNSIFRFSVAMSAPFYAAYMLQDLHFSYLTLMLVFISSSLTGMALYWGRHSDIFGNKKIMTITGWLTAILPLLWIVSANVFYLICVQMISGFVWAGFNLSTSNYNFDAVKPENRTRAFAYHNAILGSMIFLGALVGSGIANYQIQTPFFKSTYHMVFFLSGMLGIATAAYFLPRLKETRMVKSEDTATLFLDLVAIRPITGIVSEVKTGVTKGAMGFKENMKPLRERFKKGVTSIQKHVENIKESKKK